MLAVFLAGLLALPLAASAQRERYDDRNDRGRTHVAGQFDYFQLVMSWSPSHCQENSRGHNDTQCGMRRAKAFAFVLHGLWPQYERGYPEFCRTRQRPFVPNPVIDSVMDVMPSRGLIIHQYKKHGTCTGLRPSDYFRVARAWYKRIKVPPRFQAPRDTVFATPDDLVSDFVQANPGLKPDMIRVICRRGNANQLREIRICMTKAGQFRSCGGRPDTSCAPRRMFIPPAR